MGSVWGQLVALYCSVWVTWRKGKEDEDRSFVTAIELLGELAQGVVWRVLPAKAGIWTQKAERVAYLWEAESMQRHRATHSLLRWSRALRSWPEHCVPIPCACGRGVMGQLLPQQLSPAQGALCWELSTANAVCGRAGTEIWRSRKVNMFCPELALVRSLVKYLRQFLIPVIRKKDIGRTTYQR